MIAPTETKAIVIDSKGDTDQHSLQLPSKDDVDAKSKYHCLCGVHVATAARWIALLGIASGVCYASWLLLVGGAYVIVGRSLLNALLGVSILLAQRWRNPRFYLPHLVFNGAFLIVFTVVLAILIFATAFLPSDETVHALKVVFNAVSKAQGFDGVPFEDLQQQFGTNGVQLYVIVVWSYALVLGAWFYSIVWRAWRYLQEQQALVKTDQTLCWS